MDTPIPAQLPTVPPQESSSRTILFVGGLALLIAAIGYMGYQNWLLRQQVDRLDKLIQVDNKPYNFSSPTLTPPRLSTGSIDITTWKTYTNSQYGFSFKYPNTMDLSTSEAAQDRDFLVTTTANLPNPVNFSVALYAEHLPKSTLESQTQRFHDPNVLANPPIQTGEFSSITTIQIAGVTANMFSSNLCAQSRRKCTVYILSHVGFVFKIDTTESVESSIADQILSTFKFLDQTIDTSNWQTYSNSEWKLSFKYPNNMDTTCCSIGVPNGQAQIVFAMPKTVKPQVDKSFDGFGVAVFSQGPSSFDQIISTQENLLYQEAKEANGSTPSNPVKTKINVAGTEATKLTGYSIFGTEYIYMPHLQNETIVTIAHTNASPGSFDTVFNAILSTFKFTSN